MPSAGSFGKPAYRVFVHTTPVECLHISAAGRAALEGVPAEESGVRVRDPGLGTQPRLERALSAPRVVPAMRRRGFLLATGCVVAGAGCAGDRIAPTGTGSVSGDSTSNGGPSGVTVESVNAADVRRGTDEQRITVALSTGASGGEVEVFLDVSALRDASVGLADLGVEAEARYGHGWTVTDAAVSAGDGVVRTTVAVDEGESVDGTGTIRLLLTGLDTGGLEHTSGLTHRVAVVGAGEDVDFSNGVTADFDAVDPDELEDVLRVRPDRLRVGDGRQRVHVTIEHASDEIAFRMDLAPLAEVGVGVDDAGVEVVAVENDLEDDLEPVDAVEAGVVDGVVRVDLVTEADMVGLVLSVTGLETDGAAAGSEVSYPVWTGERPSAPTESRTFRIAGATA